jgi:FkbM family methyltransferase
MLLDKLPGLFAHLSSHWQEHARSSEFYRFHESVMKHAIEESKSAFEKEQGVLFGETGRIVLPYQKMGAIDSLDLFGLDELIVFAFYHRTRGKYRRAADIGANLGLHSIMMAKCGIAVDAFEPDPTHFKLLKRNLSLNGIGSCVLHEEAVSDHVGQMEFVRVLGNTTGSHLAGAKENPYGDLERFEVKVADIKEIAAQSDFLKVDAEGHEDVILAAIPRKSWECLDAIAEIGSQKNASTLFSHFRSIGVNVFAQKLGWQKVTSLEHMPASYKEGGVFVSAKAQMPW